MVQSQNAGLLPGDRFIKVGDSVVAHNGITPERIKLLLRGQRGSQVSITLMRGVSIKTVIVKRGTIPLYSVDAAYMINDTTAFIHLNKFSGTSYEETMAALEKLKNRE